MGEEPSGAAHAALHLVEDKQHAALVAQAAQRPERLVGQRPDSALALHRLGDDRGGVLADGLGHGAEIAEGHLGEARQERAEARDHLLAARSGDARRGAPVEGPLEGDDADPLGLPRVVEALADHLDGEFARFGA